MCRNVQIDFRALAHATSNGNITSQALGSLLHSGHSIVARTAQIQRFLVYAATVILNSNQQVPLAIAQQDMNPAGVSVLKGVRDRLATNLQNVIAGRGVQPALVPFDNDINFRSAVSCEFP
jgi:hypothetical protein